MSGCFVLPIIHSPVIWGINRFLGDDTEAEASTSWNDQLAKKYYDSLYCEFALCNLKHYKCGNVRPLLPFLGSVTNTSSTVFIMNAQFSLRWRTENEVLDGTGEMTCANMRCEYHCPHSAPNPPSLTTLELPFTYEEKGVAKQALVKVIMCPKCVRKLMWKKTRERRTEKGKAVGGNVNESRGRESVEETEAQENHSW